MKKLLLIPVLLLAAILSHAQYIHKIKADSVLITNDSCNAELNLENSTKDTLGFLYNKGKGRTEFRRGLIKINDSLYIIGSDTLNTAKGAAALLNGNYIQNQTAALQAAGSGFFIEKGIFGQSAANGTTKSKLTIDPTNSSYLFNITGGNSTNPHKLSHGIMTMDLTSVNTVGMKLFNVAGTPNTGIIPYYINLTDNHMTSSATGFDLSYLRTAAGINYSTYGFKSTVDSYAGTGYACYANATATGGGTAYAFYGAAGMNYFSGNVGIGTLPTSAYTLNVLSSTNASSQIQLVNGALQVTKSNSQVASTYQSWARTSPTSTFRLQYQNANTSYSGVPEVGTLNGHNIGASYFVTTGAHSSGNGLATLIFDDQTSATNPNSLIMMLDNGKRPMSWRKDGSTTISSDGLMAHYVAGTDVAGNRLKLSGGRSTGTGAGGSIEFYTTAAGGTSGTTVNNEMLRMKLLSNGRLLLNTSTDNGQQLQVSGNTLLNGHLTVSNNTSYAGTTIYGKVSVIASGNQSTSFGSVFTNEGLGLSNTYVGASAGRFLNSSSDYNTIVGTGAISAGSTRDVDKTTALGYMALNQVTSSSNTAIGNQSSAALTSGTGITIGTLSGNDIATGTDNIIVGRSAFTASESDWTNWGSVQHSNVIAIGHYINNGASFGQPGGSSYASINPPTITNSIILGNGIATDKSNAIILGKVNQSTYIASLDTDLTPPSTTGTTKMVIADSEGKLSIANAPASVNYTPQTLTDGATITWDASNGINGEITLGGNRTLAFSNLTSVVGRTLNLIVSQDGSGNRTLTLPSSCKVVNGGSGALSLSTAANVVDMISFYVHSASVVFVSYGKNFN
ncbi:beta strand repeat-containing protein [Terrimonas alba]|uniref:beta strand repeat-containing protein n=1 Tax=Terrimonas alba TaxID=3349636 RepID=UPI0035F387B4